MFQCVAPMSKMKVVAIIPARMASSPNPDECASNSEGFVGIKGFGAVYGYGHQQLYQDIVSYYCKMF